MRSDEIESRMIAYLQKIPDPRKHRGIRYRYSELLLMILYAVLAGHSQATEIEYYVELNFEYFKKLIGLKSVPSHDTFSKVMRMTDVAALGENISVWIRDHFPEICKKVNGNRVLHVDGKAVRAASAKSEGEKTVYNMNAMYEGEGISLYLSKIGDKENEVSALPAYLDLFELKNTIVTIDAIGCNPKTIGRILDKKGHYLMPVKDNQPRLKEEIQEEVKRLERKGQFEKLETARREKKEHGRIESIKMHIIKNTAFLYEKLGLDSFYGSVAKIGIIDKKTIRKEAGKETTSMQRSIVITDMQNISAENLLKIKLSHWNVEAQHWLLDVQLNEDRMTARKENAVPTGAILRRFCLLMRKYTPEFEGKPLNRFLMSNEHDIQRIEKILFMKTQSVSDATEI